MTEVRDKEALAGEVGGLSNAVFTRSTLTAAWTGLAVALYAEAANLRVASFSSNNAGVAEAQWFAAAFLAFGFIANVVGAIRVVQASESGEKGNPVGRWVRTVIPFVLLAVVIVTVACIIKQSLAVAGP